LCRYGRGADGSACGRFQNDRWQHFGSFRFFNRKTLGDSSTRRCLCDYRRWGGLWFPDHCRGGHDFFRRWRSRFHLRLFHNRRCGHFGRRDGLRGLTNGGRFDSGRLSHGLENNSLNW
jgi:hypothetical protein